LTTVYRLTKRRHQTEIFSGLGGLHASGRWTPRGHRVIYTSGSIALAVLEYTLNYKHRGWVPASVLASAQWPDDVKVETAVVDRLPKNWSDAVAPLTLQDVGRVWLERLETAVLQVPSAVVVEEWNFLLNPAHPDFRRLRLSRPRPYSFDRRLARTRKR
jgi:RES domain-containing protein